MTGLATLVRYLLACTLSVIAVWRGVAFNAVVSENSILGVNNWYQVQRGRDKKLKINGFSTKISYFPGERVEFKISSHPGTLAYHIEICRLGYYNGLGARQVGIVHMVKNIGKHRIENGTFPILKQPPCMFDEENRVTDCSNWHTTAHLTVPADATSGVYVALPVHNKSRIYYGTYIPFIIRKVLKVGDGDKESLLFKTSDMTWQAYNRYGTYNLYRGTQFGWAQADTRAFKASYNRPSQNRAVPPWGHDINFIFGAEYPMIFWLEKHGYDVSYCASQDVETMHQDGTLLNYKAILSVGHDEYWTPGMKTAHEYARDHGVHLAFFSGNEVFWRTVWDEDTQRSKQQGGPFAVDSAGNKSVPLDPKRMFVCRKETLDTVPASAPAEWTGTFRDPRFRLADHESLLTGQNFLVNGVRHDAMTVTAGDAELRFWRNATFAQSHAPPHAQSGQGSIVHQSPSGLLGYEWDVFPENDERHPGLIPLSTTTMEITGMLAENFGATYNGSGTVVHRLSLYRQYNFAPSNQDEVAAAEGDGWTYETACATKASKPTLLSTALVFGAGTVQWSWALSDKHDGAYMRPDRDIQQATLNLFADMELFPGSFVADMTPPLVLPVASTDVYPPSSSITSARQKAGAGGAVNTVTVEVRGTARDDERGGGAVAAVEVSADGGRTWALAVGRGRWHYTFVLDTAAATRPVLNTPGTEPNSHDPERWLRDALIREHGGVYCTNSSAGSAGEPSQRQCSLLVLSRAVDDSGWIEETDALAGLCTLIAGRQPPLPKLKSRNARIVHIVQ